MKRALLSKKLLDKKTTEMNRWNRILNVLILTMTVLRTGEKFLRIYTIQAFKKQLNNKFI
jgi:hypothetical protein